MSESTKDLGRKLGLSAVIALGVGYRWLRHLLVPVRSRRSRRQQSVYGVGLYYWRPAPDSF